jgi:cytosine/uracil/thiamine/allantoin permease
MSAALSLLLVPWSLLADAVIMQNRVEAFNNTAADFMPSLFGAIIFATAVFREKCQFAQRVAAADGEAPPHWLVSIGFDEIVVETKRKCHDIPFG